MKRIAELLTDHHLVVIRIKWWGVLPNRPCKPKQVMWMNWECLAVALFKVSTPTSKGIFQPPQWRLLTWKPAGPCSKPPLGRWLLGVVARGSSVSVTKEPSGGHQQLKRLSSKKESFWALLAQGTGEAAYRYCDFRRTVASVVVKEKKMGVGERLWVGI